MRVYIASLSDYNNGRLEGKWFDLSDYLSASDLMDDINDMLEDLTKKYNDGEIREEWAVHDYEGIPPTLASEYMTEADFEKLMEIRKVAEDRDIPVEVLVERAGDTGSDDYEALADSLVMVVDGSDETDIVYELESQMGELGNDFWKDYIFIDDVTERVMYGEDVDRFREDILDENPDMDEDEAESQAEEMADEEADRRRDLSTYLEDMGYGDEIPNFVTKDYNDAWKYALSYDYDVIHHDDQMYVFTNNYSVGGTILSGLVGAYIGYQIGKKGLKKVTSNTKSRIGNATKKVKSVVKNKKFAKGGKYNQSWHQDHYRHNKGESYEVPVDKRKYAKGGKTPISFKGYTINFIRGEYRAEAYGNPQFSDKNLAKLKQKINSYLRGDKYAKGGGVGNYEMYDEQLYLDNDLKDAILENDTLSTFIKERHFIRDKNGKIFMWIDWMDYDQFDELANFLGYKYAKGGGVEKDSNYYELIRKIENNERVLKNTYGSERVEQVQQEIQRLKDELKNKYGYKYAQGGKMQTGGGVDTIHIGTKIKSSSQTYVVTKKSTFGFVMEAKNGDKMIKDEYEIKQLIERGQLKIVNEEYSQGGGISGLNDLIRG